MRRDERSAVLLRIRVRFSDRRSEAFCAFLQYLHIYTLTLPRNITSLLPSTSFSIHHCSSPASCSKEIRTWHVAGLGVRVVVVQET
jgi:hypothetical protein